MQIKTGHKNWLYPRELLFMAAALAVNMLVYSVARWIAAGSRHYDMTTVIDRAIPLVSWMIVFYFGCYLFCAVNYALSIKCDKRDGWQFFNALCFGFVICFIIFIVFPTTMVRPDIVGSGVFDHLLKFQYRIDASDNLFPSIHCFVSWICWIGVRGKREIPKWYQRISLMMAIAVCLSTLMVKQHVIADVVSGVALAELSYLISAKSVQQRPPLKK